MLSCGGEGSMGKERKRTGMRNLPICISSGETTEIPERLFEMRVVHLEQSRVDVCKNVFFGPL